MSEKTWTERINKWADDRNLIAGSTAKDQMLKLTEEIGELSQAIQKGNQDGIVDAIGDCAVVLAIMARQLGTDFDDCKKAAWEEIKDRRGEMRNGVFVKEVAK